LNGFELAGRAIRVGLGNDKFTNESTQAILDRYDGFRGTILDTVPLDDTERLGGGGGRRGGGGRMVGNLDDADVAGVSFQNVSREALMRKLARDEPKEEPAPYIDNETMLTFSPKPLSQIQPPDVSRCVLLKNCFNPTEESGSAWVKELEEDVKHECEEKYGKVCISS
jgi:RNA-binding protein 23/39